MLAQPAQFILETYRRGAGDVAKRCPHPIPIDVSHMKATCRKQKTTKDYAGGIDSGSGDRMA
ncbi:hypothetical protein GCM10011586_10400 [Silvibacterium dinghuense]|nr:hypothetical protein GCM10011586_10400 [Silvibacterium dinghuense]